jgi:hypothetical protein
MLDNRVDAFQYVDLCNGPKYAIRKTVARGRARFDAASALSELNFRVDGTIDGVESHTSTKRQRVCIRGQLTLTHSLALRAGKRANPKS